MSQQLNDSINKALESYGAKTFGSLQRRKERLHRFTQLRNKRYIAEAKLRKARLAAQEGVQRRVSERIAQLYQEEERRSKTESGVVTRSQSWITLGVSIVMALLVQIIVGAW